MLAWSEGAPVTVGLALSWAHSTSRSQIATAALLRVFEIRVGSEILGSDAEGGPIQARSELKRLLCHSNLRNGYSPSSYRRWISTLLKCIS